MNLIFIGTLKFSRELLNVALSSQLKVIGIISKEKSPFNSDHEDLCVVAKKVGIDYFYYNKNDIEMLSWLKGKNVDIIFCFGWSHLLHPEILNLSRLGVIGYHPAKLPQNRGRHPIIWALVLGLRETGSTFFFINNGEADSGDIINQEIISIGEEDSAHSLYLKLQECAIAQLEFICNQLLTSNLIAYPQRNDLANSWRKRTSEDGLIDWRMSSQLILNLIRALGYPYSGAETKYKDKKYKIFKARYVGMKKQNFEPGKILTKDFESIQITTGDGIIEIICSELLEQIEVGDYLS
jgi:methionyl-tRNA formyltransferase